ncbi:Histidine kinase/HSP90-like ATPase superfamily [Arabidopsis suecica]|uniref:Histidine kinase/HSP90-like ATPase superfamily n=1 Tax=Arabidopsis suecica TaxID=45249 RepID=A0A8T2FFL6_ARASU|nr:Histidine kinase/HSP90-like ATPase superfamily [Arabidopsis suecica]
MTESAKQHIERIRRTKFSIGGAENPLTEDLHQAVKNLSAELYAKDVHFLMELIQNAEDNEYPEGVDPSLEFVITSEDITNTGAPATLLIFNNEKGFSEKNIESICSVGRSTKKGNRKCGYIGEKGIGFKSVFLITSQPYIFSNGYQIRFNEAPCSHCSLGYIVPEWVDQHPSLVDIQRMYGSGSALPTTTIILPLKSDKVKPVKEQLSNVHPEVLLFLSKIKRLSIREHCLDPKLSTVNSIGIVSETNFVTRKSIDAESYTIHLSASEKGKNSEQECSYYMWRQKFPVKHENRVDRRSEVEEWVITLAFPFGERLGHGNNSPGIYAFLPTEMVTNFPFIIQAHFILESSREMILLDDIWNQGILNCVPLAFLNAFTSLVKTTDAPVSSLLPAFRFLPVKESNYAKLNVVRESIRARVCAEEIVPSISHQGQKFFYKPCEVGRLIPTFWDILEKAGSEGTSLQNISSHGIYILNSAFDRTEYDNVLNFLGLKQVSNEWYVKCIQGCDLVTSVSEATYVEVLLFIAENWQCRFQNTNMGKVPLIKYVVQKGVSSLSSLGGFSPRTLCLSTEKNQAWLLDWNDEFRCMSNFVFMPPTIRTALKVCSKKEIIHTWLKENVKVITLSVSDYAKHLRENLNGDKRLVVAYAHFLHHSISKDFLSKEEAGKCCKDMPLVDNYGNVNISRNGVLVPASEGKWVSLVGSNPWRHSGYIELSEEYLLSNRFAGLRSNKKDLLGFLKSSVEAGDIPDIEPPNVAIPALSGPLTKENVFLLLEWINKCNRHSLRSNFLNSVRGGSWLRTTMNGVSDYRPPSQSFYHTSSWGSILQNGSILVDIPLVDRSYYGNEIEKYKEELKIAGVMFEFSEACRFVGNHLMSLAETSTQSSANVFSILKFIRYLREKRLSPADFITAVKNGPWLKTISGYRSPDGAVLFSEEWKAASLISDIPFIDRGFYGVVSLNGYKEELELLGVVVKFPDNYSLIVSHLNTAKLTYLTPDAMFLVLDCMRQLSPHRLINALWNSSQCFKTKKNGYKSPAECFIPDPEWTCLLSVFDCFPLIDDDFYGSRIFAYKGELKQIGVKLQLEEAVKMFVSTFKQKATSSGLTRCTASSLLSCYKKLMGSLYKYPEELMKSFKQFQWLHTKLGDFRAPKDCILFDSEWEPLRLIANLPFIDDGPNWYGKSIHEFRKELESLGVTVELRKGMSHVISSLSLPDPSRIAPSSALSLFKCIKFLREDRFQQLPKELLDKVSVKWLKTHAGYCSPEECLLFDRTWKLELCDGPFIDEEYYGSDINSFREELIAIGVGHDSDKACQLLARNVYKLSETDAISRVYRFLSEAEWKPEKGASSGRIWIPSDEKWADISSCVLFDKDKLFGSKFNVLENHYCSGKDHNLLGFFSSAFGVRINPSIEDYCELWKYWEKTKNRLSSHECCAFWSFVVRHGDTVKAEKLLSESFSRLPVHSPDCNNNEGVMLSSISDVFIADDLLLKDMFIDSPVFVWYPTPSIPTLSRTRLIEIYRNIGVKEVSKCVEIAEADLTGFKTELQEVVDPKKNLIGPGLVKLILAFLSDPSLKVEAAERLRIIHSLVDIDVKETSETITTEYTLSLPSKGEKLIAKAKRMIRWEREKGVVYAEKMEKTCGKRKLLEYATCFAEVIAKGVMWEREDLIGRLSELVKMAYLVEFDEEALEFLMKSKNLQVYEEDEKLISDEFSQVN